MTMAIMIDIFASINEMEKRAAKKLACKMSDTCTISLLPQPLERIPGGLEKNYCAK